MPRIGGLQDGDDESKARLRAWELELEDRALERFPEIRELGTFGDPEFEEALDAAVDMIDGEDGSTSGATIELQMDLEELELNGDSDEATRDDATVTDATEPARASDQEVPERCSKSLTVGGLVRTTTRNYPQGIVRAR